MAWLFIVTASSVAEFFELCIPISHFPFLRSSFLVLPVPSLSVVMQQHTHLGPLSGVGNLTSSEVEHSTLHFTWTAPYTLQGVPINYYTINITRHSDGAVLRSDTTNTTEYLYTVSSLGETLEVVVAAVNGAGTGNVSKITVQVLSSKFCPIIYV